MTNSKLKLFYISQSLAFCYFWIAMSVPYLLYRGLSTSQVFSLMALYQLAGVIFEYPTGLLGDRFGYRKATYLANTLNFIATLLLAFPGTYYYYLIALLILALGNGFSSGNDMGILKHVSNNIKKDTANYNALMDIILFFSAIIGGFLSKWSYSYTLIISAILMFTANFPLYFLRNGINQSKNLAPFSQIIKDGFRALRNYSIANLFIYTIVFGGFAFTIKSIFGSFGTLYQTELATIGILVGLGGLFRSIGSKLAAEYPLSSITIPTLVIGILLLITGLRMTSLTMCVTLLLSQIFLGYSLSSIDGQIHDLASDHIRASLFSIKRLSMRLVASGYLYLFGLVAQGNNLHILIFFTGVVMIITVFSANLHRNLYMGVITKE